PFAAQTSNSTPSSAAKTQLVILGTGTPKADPDTSGPSVAVVVGGSAYLIDCGPGVVRRAAAAQRKGISALLPSKIQVAFITHLHSDHTVGYPDLIFTAGSQRKRPLEVYGPKGLQRMTSYIQQAWSEDVYIRSHGPNEPNPIAYKVNVHEIKPGVVYKDDNVTVSAFLVAHGNWAQAFGYKFETADRTIVISGDTSPTDAIVKACNHCDILLHEAYGESRVSHSAKSNDYFRTFHTSVVELAKEATEAKPGLLILYHQMYSDGQSYDQLLDEARQHYQGKVVSARDLDVY
ncbi:MAG TPA: MBL fold metallo-hydrolase, partial [Terriglobales bacterium]|nr:MBL fold metallo-hydrolase [Terriglobales bacterium]